MSFMQQRLIFERSKIDFTASVQDGYTPSQAANVYMAASSFKVRICGFFLITNYPDVGALGVWSSLSLMQLRNIC